MKSIINNPSEVVDDMLKGFLKAHNNLIVGTKNPKVVKYIAAPVKNKVGIVTGGGSGHEPAFLGYVGKNMVDAVAIGEVFSSPTANSFLDAFREADAGKGVACLYGNYAGDNMNVKMAIQMAQKEGIEVKTAIATDDVPSASKDEISKRRGLAGGFCMWKIASALASKGADLNTVIDGAQKAINNTRSVGIGLTPCTIPEVGVPNFQIEDGKMEFGIGHHGEPGVRVEDLKTADEIATQMVVTLLSDKAIASSQEVMILLSGLGSTPVLELYILYNKIEELLNNNGIKKHVAFVGNLATSLDMKGAVLSIMELDQELKALVDVEIDTVGAKQF